MSDNGFPGFMAPEMRFRKGGYTTNVDIYSFAMMIGEMINGRRPFHYLERNSDYVALKDQQRPSYKDTVESLYGLLPLTDLMTKMWKEKGTDRPSAEEVLRQAQNCCFQLFYGKKTILTKEISISAVGEKTFWIGLLDTLCKWFLLSA